MKRLRISVALLLFSLTVFSSASANVVVTYQFQDSLAADQVGVTAISAIDPLGSSGFATATLYGTTRRVYQFSGNSSFNEQAGLSLDTAGLIAPDNYSIEIVFSFFATNQSPNGYRRILDTHNRTADQGIYVNDGDRLIVSAVGGASASFNPSGVHHVVVTNSAATNLISVYLDGVLAVSGAANSVDITNAAGRLNLFVDDGFEYSSGQVALVRLHDSVLSATDVAAIALSPLPAIPEPEAYVMMIVGVNLVGLIVRRTRRRTVYSNP